VNIGAGRHLAVPILLQHVADGITTVFPFPGDPPVSLLIEAQRPRLTLRARTNGPSKVPPNPLRHVSVTPTFLDGSHILEVSISGRELLLDGHALLCSIADRIQLEGMPPPDAIAETLAQWRSVLALRTRLPLETEIGLFGELTLLEALCGTSGSSALDAWRGSLAEEHDFGLLAVDAEVKTTSSDRREHWISGIRQLEPTGNRTLYLVSVQITRGGQSGRTLPELIAVLRAAWGAPSLNEKLERAGWCDDTADLFTDRWRLRSAPAAYLVDDVFPALTPATIGEISRDMSPLREVAYKIDLGELPTVTPKSSDLSLALQSLDPHGTTQP
jgi:hypothetical protein